MSWQSKTRRQLKTSSAARSVFASTPREIALGLQRMDKLLLSDSVAETSVVLRAHQSEISKSGPHVKPSWWQGTSDTPHRVLTLVPEEGVSNHNHSAVHPAGRLLATPVSRGITLTDLETGKRAGFIAAGGCVYCFFDAQGNLYAQRTGPDGWYNPHRWTVKVNDHRYEIVSAEQINFRRSAGFAITSDARFVAEADTTAARSSIVRRAKR